MSRHTRREFLKRTAAAGAALSLAGNRVFAIDGTKSSGKILGANETIRVAVAGINGRGESHIHEFGNMKNVEIAYLVDPDSRLFQKRSAEVERLSKKTPKCVQDLRKALEDPELHVVSIASCNHWHSLLTIWACQAEKDVYVEKPCSHNVFEGRKCVEAARRYNRIVQHGTQSRSDGKIAKQIAAVHSGKYGKLLVSKGYANKVRWNIGFKEPKAPPAGFDYNLWLGPAPEQPYHENIVHYNWHWFWDFGNGEIGNQGVHQMDIARWAIPGGTLPRSVISMGGRYVDAPGYKDQGQTPNMQISVFDFGGTLLVFEVRGLTGRKGVSGKDIPSRVENEFYLEEGVIRDGKFYPKGKKEPQKLVDAKIDIRPGNHFKNFIDCVRSRKQDQLNAEILEGHYSAALCHLGNISYRLGHEEAPLTQEPKALGSDATILASFKDIQKNLKDALGMKLDEVSYRVGAKLEFDAGAEKFLGNDEANKLLTRPYRKPFVVPEKV